MDFISKHNIDTFCQNHLDIVNVDGFDCYVKNWIQKTFRKSGGLATLIGVKLCQYFIGSVYVPAENTKYFI